MKLKYEFEAVNMGEEYILVPIGEAASRIHGVVNMNEAGLEIVNLLKMDTSESAMADALAAKYDNGREELLSFIRNVLQTLRENGLLEE